MNFPAALKSGTFAALVAQAVHAGPLDTYRGPNRLIVVSVPDNSSATKVAAALGKHRERIAERELKIVDVSEVTHRIPAALRLSNEQVQTVGRLNVRVNERFPKSGLGQVAGELYIQRFDDSVALAAVDGIEDLTNGLSRKIWQKIAMLEEAIRKPD